MQPRSRARLWDAREAAATVQRFVAGRTLDDYQNDIMLRSAVERQFTIAGEALAQLRNADPAVIEQVPHAAQVVGMRNILVHGYAEIDHATVWRAATSDAAELIDAISALLDGSP